jgi:hypothetical protein
MELKDFISEILKQTVEGVVSAQLAVKDKGAKVVPGEITTNAGLLYTTGNRSANVQMIEFDILLTKSHNNEAKAGIGVFFGSIGVGGQGKTEAGTNASNRVKFSVPVVFPSQ